MSSISECCLRYGSPWVRFFHVVCAHQEYLSSRPNLGDAGVQCTHPFRCSACLGTFRTKKDLSVHLKECTARHTTPAAFACGLCSGSTPESMSESMSGSSPTSGLVFKAYTDRGLLFHFLKHHRVDVCAFPCPKPLCDVLKPSPSELALHLRKKHGVPDEDSQAEASRVAAAVFPARVGGEPALQRVPTYRCPCGVVDFSGPSGAGKQHVKNYERHIARCEVAVREGIRPKGRSCEHCGKVCGTSDALAHHVRICPRRRVGERLRGGGDVSGCVEDHSRDGKEKRRRVEEHVDEHRLETTGLDAAASSRISPAKTNNSPSSHCPSMPPTEGRAPSSLMSFIQELKRKT